MYRRTLFLVLAVVIASFAPVSSTWADSDLPTAESKLQQISLFKNGLGFFVSQVEIPKNTRAFSIIPDVAATHGTFWVSYPHQVKLSSLVAASVDSEKMTPAVSITELLRANIGQRVRLNFHNKDVQCLIKYFPDDRIPLPPRPYALGRSESSRIRPTNSRLMLIETDEGQIAIDPNVVQRIEFLEATPNTTFPVKEKTTRINVTLDSPAGGKDLTLSHLAKGITWAPSYMVDISDPEKARISAKAAIINDVTDLDGVSIQLVTGFPNLQFSDIVSPFALKQNLAQFLQALTAGQSGRSRGARASVMFQQTAGDYMREAPSIMPDYGSADTGTVAEDLFFYPIANVTLKKDQVGYYPLFTESVDYSHVYRWEIPDYINEDGRYNPQRNQPDESDEDVWHCLKLANSTKVPWTTAPAETVKDGFILGQDTLKYTAVGDKTLLRITKAMSVKVHQVELEEGRDRGVLTAYGRNWDLVRIRGTLSVKNFQAKDISLEITKTLSGKVLLSDPEAKVQKLAKGLRSVNERSQLTWTIDLEPGQDTEISYTYHAHVAR